MSEKFLTAIDVAWMLNLNVETTRSKMRKGEIPAIKMGGVWRATESDLIKWMNEQRLVK